MRDIAEYLVKALGEGRDLVLVTVAGGSGSAPRHAGSQMLVSAEGRACGTIGGGALEAHAIAEGRTLLGGGQGRFERLGLEADLGMACGGGAELLYTPVCAGDASWAQVAAAALRCLDARTPATLLLRCLEGARSFKAAVALVDAKSQVIAGCPDAVHGCFAEGATAANAGDEVAVECCNAGCECLSSGVTAPSSEGEGAAGDSDGAQGRFGEEAAPPNAGNEGAVGGNIERATGGFAAVHQRFAAVDAPQRVGDWFVQPLPISVRAVVFGGGHVGRAVVAALSRVGFSCTVFDSRPEFARPEDFPAAREVMCGDYGNIAASLTLDERDFILIMTPGHRSDFTVLEQVLRQPHAYVGLIGSRRKVAEARKQMLAAGIPQAAIDAVHMPIGLEIGAETPEEIAVSIAAECIAQRASR